MPRSLPRRLLACLCCAWLALLPVGMAEDPAPASGPATVSAGPKVAGLELPADFAAPDGLERVTLRARPARGTVKWLVVGSVPVDYTVRGNSIDIVLPSSVDGEATIFVYAVGQADGGGPTDFARTAISVGQRIAPPRPPAPPVNPPPPPAPKAEGRLHVTFVEDVQTRTPDVAALVASQRLRQQLEAMGCVVRVMDVRDPKVKAAKLDAPVSAVGKLPALVIQTDDGRLWPQGNALALPASEDAIVAAVKTATGR